MNKLNIKLLTFLAIAVTLSLLIGAGGGAVYALAQGQDSGGQEALDAEQGLLVAGVVPDSPAAQAGIKRGDILIQMNNQPVNRAGELIGQIQSLAVGDQVEFRLLHGDEERTLSATLGDRNGQPYLGIIPCGERGMAFTIAEPLKPGATIMEVTPDSPAAQAGLQPKDTITAVDGQPLEAGQSLSELIRQHAPGDTITLTVERPGEQAREVTVTLANHPQQAGAPYLGVRFSPFPGMGGGFPGRVFPGQPGSEGSVPGQPAQPMEQAIVIRQVTENSPAAAAGLAPDDLITAIEGQPVRGPRALVEMVAQSQPGDTLTLTVTRAGTQGSRDVTVTLAENPDQAGATYLGVLIGGVNILRSENGVDILEDMQNNFMTPGMRFEMAPSIESHGMGFETAPFYEFKFEQLPPDIIKAQPCPDPAKCGDTI